MKKSIKLGVVASALMAVAGFAFAQTGAGYKPDPSRALKLVDAKESPYVIDRQRRHRPRSVRSVLAHWQLERRARCRGQDRGRSVPELDRRLRVRS